jgi:hypothetical protein
VQNSDGKLHRAKEMVSGWRHGSAEFGIGNAEFATHHPFHVTRIVRHLPQRAKQREYAEVRNLQSKI